jgi:tRNA/tmRNA/rRNA uracil-C5-methylase (TrmA/RlmC/RlmD family)
MRLIPESYKNTASFGDIKAVLNQEFINNGRPDVIITDPPRPECRSIKSVILVPEKVYISCNLPPSVIFC